MTSLRLVLLLAFFWVPPVVAQPVAPAPSAPEQKEDGDLRGIRAIFDRWQTAWNTHDMHAFARLFHEDGIWVVWTGRVWRGRSAIEQGHVEAHRTFFRNSTQLLRIEELRRVAPDVAIVHLYSTLAGDEREPGATIRARKLVVVTRRDGVWRIASGQNTRLTAAVTE
jgi:uncharacterized protein (TIGR02246 family)